MIRKIKALGLAFVAIAAMSAIAASGAQAASAFDFGVTPSVVKATNETGQAHVLTLTSTGGSKFNTSCPAATLEGTISTANPVQEATLTPTYGPNCTAFGLASTVVTNGCQYTVKSTATALTATVDVVNCTSGKQIEIKTALCTLDIGEQAGLSHIVATQLAANEVTLNATVSGIKVTQTGAGCPDGNGHVGTNASFTGNTIAKAFADGGSTLVTKHGHQYLEYTAGAASTITAT
jgi:hypothetical protein